MTDEQREELKRLAIAAAVPEGAVRMAGYWNVPREPDKAAEQAARYGLLRAEAVEARAALETAIAALGKPAEPWVRELAAEMIDAARKSAA